MIFELLRPMKLNAVNSRVWRVSAYFMIIYHLVCEGLI